MADRSEMARNVIKSVFRTSKMAAGGHFVTNCKKSSISISNYVVYVGCDPNCVDQPVPKGNDENPF